MSLNYENNFWQGLTVINDNFETKIKDLKYLKFVYSEYSSIEANYYDGLIRLMNFSFGLGQQTTLSIGLESLFNVLKQEAVRHLLKSEALKKVILDIDNNIKTFQKDFIVIEGDYKQNDEDFFSILRNLELSKKQFHRTTDEVENKTIEEFSQQYQAMNNNPSPGNNNNNITGKEINVSAIQKNFSEDQAQKIINSCQNSLAKAKESQIAYEKNLYQANQARESYINHYKRIMLNFKEIDERIITFFKSTLISFNTICINNSHEIIKDFNESHANFKKIDAKKDIEIFIDLYKTKGNEPFKLEYNGYHSHNKAFNNFCSILPLQEQNKISNIVSSTFNQFKTCCLEDKTNKDSSRIIALTQLAYEGTMTQIEIDEMKEYLNKEINQKCFLAYFNQFRVKGVYRIKDETYDYLTVFFNKIYDVLNMCERPEDMNIEMVLYALIISQTYYKGEKEYEGDNRGLIQKAIINHPIWKPKELWIVLIQYDITSHMNNKNNHEDYVNGLTMEKEEMVCNNARSTIICQYSSMIEFGFKENDIIEIIKPICQKYNVDLNIIIESFAIHGNEILSGTMTPMENNEAIITEDKEISEKEDNEPVIGNIQEEAKVIEEVITQEEVMSPSIPKDENEDGNL